MTDWVAGPISTVPARTVMTQWDDEVFRFFVEPVDEAGEPTTDLLVEELGHQVHLMIRDTATDHTTDRATILGRTVDNKGIKVRVKGLEPRTSYTLFVTLNRTDGADRTQKLQIDCEA